MSNGRLEGWKVGRMKITSLPSFRKRSGASKSQAGSKLVTIIRPKTEIFPTPHSQGLACLPDMPGL
jgi:hypothetical protein